ncbi:uncharacterized protein LACBIDRAFT_310182 [Laccaria bicolor S238N-H82]|uniref:Predicted protein n=1 Tax=Laccaria bicolor (strain S238N-H82 / ATCC MYA-4686) TaxID=486041 RepID=B0DU13_LACBS|nr:uncharacterized protein LACBIDRAFT_310182 [Laccaria bicolor S238N-H82]EDR02007.1 predicted protein [Laccaria bicolor S238N-H82]|eukprot:XP_001887398.1 predicted protein [Laccaria bicolor S238N-H82]
MKVDFEVPSNCTLLCTGTSSTPPSFPSPPSGSEAKQFFTLLTFLPTDVDRWEGHLNSTDARLHFGIWGLGGD